MDQRVLKTRKSLREALLLILGEKPIAHISVKEICDRSHTGRVTFYTHYKDKYDLLDDCLQDLHEAIIARFDVLERENNPDLDLTQFFLNIIDSILDVRRSYQFSSLVNNSDTLFRYYHFLMDNLQVFEKKWGKDFQTKYDKRQLYSFLVLGFGGFMHAKGPGPAKSPQEIRDEAHLLVRDLVASGIFS